MQGLAVLRRQTKTFIDENPTAIVFTRSTRESDGAGGKRRAVSTPLSPQSVRVVEQNTVVDAHTRNVGGEMLRPNIKIVAAHDDDIIPGDTFMWGTEQVQVTWIWDRKYELLCEVGI